VGERRDIYYILFVPVTEIPLFFVAGTLKYSTLYLYLYLYDIVWYCIMTDEDDLDSRDFNLLILYDREEVV